MPPSFTKKITHCNALWQTHGIDINSTYSKVYSETPPTQMSSWDQSGGQPKPFKRRLRGYRLRSESWKYNKFVLRNLLVYWKHIWSLSQPPVRKALSCGKSSDWAQKLYILEKCPMCSDGKVEILQNHIVLCRLELNWKLPFQTHCKVTTWRIFGYLLGFTRLLGH